MITFPSNTKLEMSPCKPSFQGVQSYEELDELSPCSPSKKIKED